ncbi:MAG: DUF3858 domain-containing protein, partial [Bacteroidetes bacterium]|nr:DUF3858 domain-containing protein [Bacteroidota bacterium]
LAEQGYLTFRYDNHKGWQYSLDVIVRIKIFNKNGKDEGNISLKVYDPINSTSKEAIGSIKGFTYNLVNNKIEKTKLKNSEKFETRISDYRVEHNFAMPDVQEGSVIEYRYNLVSDYISNLKTWKFQNDLPTAVSELVFTIPEFFIYNINQVGSYAILEREENIRNETFTYRYTDIINSQQNTGSISSVSQNQKIIGRNILPVDEEPYMNNKPNIPTRYEFQLMSIKMQNSPIKMMAGSYEKFNNDILKWSNFGGRLDKGNFAKDKVAKLEGETEATKALSIYNWLKNHFTWNEVYGITSNDAGRTAYNNASGSAADVNLSLVAAFRQAGLEAHPILLSTRGHGIPHPVYPNYEDFNYVVVGVKANETWHLCDATSKQSFGELPLRCLNGNGWMAAEEGGNWINLKSNANHTTALLTKISVQEDMLVASVEAQFKEYAGLIESQKLKKNGETEYQDNFSEKFPEWDLTDFSANDTSSSVKLNFNLVKNFDGEDIIYLQPILFGGITENIFKREERFSPVDFPYAINKTIMVTIDVPEGYKPELPEPIYLALPENGGKFIYSAKQLGDKINIMSTVTLTKLDFSPNEYPYIKQFYQQMADRNNEMIVLKKL